MDNSSKRKTKLLGEPFGTASGKLRKAILFSLLQETKKDICYRCNKKIDIIEELSIEHMESWELAKDPIKAFYDLKNISFSHLHCNSGAAKRKEPSHGTHNMYTTHGCRCSECRKANADNKAITRTNHKKLFL